VNAAIAHDMRRIPFQNMVYVADGMSDVPCFSLVGGSGGRTYAVYEAGSDKEFQNAYDLQRQQRVEAFGEADYSDGSHTTMWITKAVEDIAKRIVRDRERMLRGRTRTAPRHGIEQRKVVNAAVNIEHRRMIPDVLEAMCDSPALRKSPGLRESSPLRKIPKPQNRKWTAAT